MSVAQHVASSPASRALLTHLSVVRARNRAAMRRLDAIENVVQRLEYFGAGAIGGRCEDAIVREHAARIVDAVLALTRDRE